MRSILVTNKYSEDVLKIVREHVRGEFELLLADGSPEVALRLAPEADYMLAGGRMPVDEALLCAATRLRMVQRSGVGLDAIDLEGLKRHGVPLYVNPGVNAQSVAEHTVMLVLAALKNLGIVNENVHNGVFIKQPQGLKNHELCGKRVLIVGMGNIGRRVAAMLRPFGARLFYNDIIGPVPAEVEAQLGLTHLEREVMFNDADVIVLNCRLSDQTRHIVNANSLRGMKRGVVIVNTARGGLIDEAALAESLRDGKVGAAGLDVYEQEPIRPDNPLCAFRNVVMTSHIAGVTFESFNAMMEAAIGNIRLYDRGEAAQIADRRVV